MTTSKLQVCLASESLFDPEVIATYAALVLVLTAGGVAIYAACRWYRKLDLPVSTRSDDLAELARALEDDEELAPEERARVRAALERQNLGEPGRAEPRERPG